MSNIPNGVDLSTYQRNAQTAGAPQSVIQQKVWTPSLDEETEDPDAVELSGHDKAEPRDGAAPNKNQGPQQTPQTALQKAMADAANLHNQWRSNPASMGVPGQTGPAPAAAAPGAPVAPGPVQNQPAPAPSPTPVQNQPAPAPTQNQPQPGPGAPPAGGGSNVPPTGGTTAQPGPGGVPTGAGGLSTAAQVAQQQQQDAQNAASIYWQMSCDRQSWMSNIWKIIQDMQTNIFQRMQEVMIYRMQVMEKIMAKWSEINRS